MEALSHQSEVRREIDDQAPWDHGQSDAIPWSEVVEQAVGGPDERLPAGPPDVALVDDQHDQSPAACAFIRAPGA
jgi:hypothetical protein